MRSYIGMGDQSTDYKIKEAIGNTRNCPWLPTNGKLGNVNWDSWDKIFDELFVFKLTICNVCAPFCTDFPSNSPVNSQCHCKIQIEDILPWSTLL